MSRITAAVAALAVVGGFASASTEASQRAFVRSNGVDSGICTLTAPCRTFTYAMTQVDANGEIVALDTAGYGAVAVTKSVTIASAPGAFAGIAASAGDAVTIATPGVSVTLRSLNINGVGAALGVNMTSGNTLTIENCVISNFATDGIRVLAAGAAVRLVDSTVRDNIGNGLYFTGGGSASINNVRFLGMGNMSVYTYASPVDTTTRVAIADSVMMNNYVGTYTNGEAGAFANVSITRTTASNNNFGFTTEGGSTTTTSVSYSMATGNLSYGLYQSSGGNIMESQGNNTVRNNGVGNTFGTVTPFAGI